MRNLNLTPQQWGWVRYVLGLVEAIDHPGVLHLRQEIRWIEHNPFGRACQPGAGACAGGYLGRKIVLVVDPLTLDAAQLAALLVHEGRHVETNPLTGACCTRQHTCSDALCTIPAERAKDRIYQEQYALERQLRATFVIEPPPASAWLLLAAADLDPFYVLG